MRKKITIINPTPRKKIKRLKRKTKRKVLRNKRKGVIKNKKQLTKNLKRSSTVAVRRKKTRKRARKNPAGVTYIKNRKRYRSRARRMHRNPADLPSRSTDLLQMGTGAAVGGVAVPWIGNIFQLQGMMKTAAQLAISIGIYYVAKKVMPRAAIPAAAAGVGVTMYQFAVDNSILAGLGSNNLDPQDMQNLQYLQNSIGNVYPEVGAVYPQIGNVMPGIGNNYRIVEGEDEGIEEYADSVF